MAVFKKRLRGFQASLHTAQNSGGFGGGAAPPHLQTQCSHGWLHKKTHMLSSKLAQAGGWWGEPPPPLANILLAWYKGGGGAKRFILCKAGFKNGLRQRGGGGGWAQTPLPHLQTQCSHGLLSSRCHRPHRRHCHLHLHAHLHRHHQHVYVSMHECVYMYMQWM